MNVALDSAPANVVSFLGPSQQSDLKLSAWNIPSLKDYIALPFMFNI